MENKLNFDDTKEVPEESGIQKFFNSCPDRQSLAYVYKWVNGNNICYTEDDKKIDEEGIVIEWSKTGKGFGQIVLKMKDGKMYIDTECSGKDFAKEIFCNLIDSAIEE